MFREESLWIKDAITRLKASAMKGEVANIGSSTAHFRQVIQPHIHANIIQPLQNDGWQVKHIDLKEEEGVDLVADVTKPAFADLFPNRFSLTICTNLLEHVEDIKLVVDNLTAITKPGGYMLITVPYKYRLHFDPIDNGFRPTPAEIVDLFGKVAGPVIDQRIISVTDLDQYRIRKSKFPLWGHRERIAFYLGKRHKTSGVLFPINK